MTDFARVNNSVAFSGPFTVQNANDLRTNGELLWESNGVRPVKTNIDARDIIGATTYPESLTGLVWDEITKSYIGVSSPVTQVGGGGDGANSVFVSVAPGRQTAALLWPRGCLEAPVLDRLGAAGYGLSLFSVTSTGYYYIVDFVSILSSTDPTDASSFVEATNYAYASPPCASPCKITDTVVVIPCLEGISRITTGAGGTATIAAATIGAAYPINSVATNGTIAICVSRASATTGLACSIAGAIPNCSTLTHSAADYTTQSIGYDSRTGLFVRMMSGTSVGAYPNSLMFTTSADGITWSTTTGWYQVAVPSVAEIQLEDFTITASGVWLATFKSVQAVGVFRYMASSIDGGATWSLFGLGLTDTADTDAIGYKFSGGGPGAVAFSRAGESVFTFESVGPFSTGTTVAAVSV